MPEINTPTASSALHRRSAAAKHRAGSALEPLGVKVPAITASFWVTKLLTTAMGGSASDYLLSTMGYVALGLGMSGLGITLWLQFRTRRYNAFKY